jgi:hypothetical protein
MAMPVTMTMTMTMTVTVTTLFRCKAKWDETVINNEDDSESRDHVSFIVSSVSDL